MLRFLSGGGNTDGEWIRGFIIPTHTHGALLTLHILIILLLGFFKQYYGVNRRWLLDIHRIDDLLSPCYLNNLFPRAPAFRPLDEIMDYENVLLLRVQYSII